MYIGTSQIRLDSYDKVTGRAQYTDDLCPSDAYVAMVVYSEIANGIVKEFFLDDALKVSGVIRIVTCFEAPECKYDTGNHPWANEPENQGAMTQRILTSRVRYYGDPIAIVIARNELSAKRAVKLVKVTYEEYTPLLTVRQAMESKGEPIHEAYPDNIMAHTGFEFGNYEEAIKEDGLTRIEGWYHVPSVKHIQIEPPCCFCYMEGGRLVIYSPTQTPHPHRRVIGQALGIPWGDIRVIKPYVGGGFGNREDSIYEPICALACKMVGGHAVSLKISREEDIASTRVRHAMEFHAISYVRKDGTIAARYLEAFSNKGAYGHHGHAIACKAATGYRMLYRSDAIKGELYTVFTNTETAGAMRGYGAPQGVYAAEVHTDDICRQMGFDPIAFRRLNMMQKGDHDDFQGLYNYEDSLRQCMDVALEKTNYFEKYEAYKKQEGTRRKGIGFGLFWYNTAAWPFLLEASTNRMVLNQDGSIQVMSPEIDFGQGTDTVFAQIAADALCVPFSSIHMVQNQDTDRAGFGSGAYASRQTYTGGKGIYETGLLLKEKILQYASELLKRNVKELEILGGNIVEIPYETEEEAHILMTLEDLALHSYYDLEEQRLLIAEKTSQMSSGALSLGCCIAEVEVDLGTGRVDVTDLINVHDCGRVVNPVLATGQVNGGMSMAIGYALSERIIYDEKSGRILNNNMLDYKLPSAMDHPNRLQAAFVENPEPTSPIGTKSLGEPPVVPVAPAIRNAVLNATGVAFNDLPMDPETCLMKFKEEGLS